MRPLEYDQYLFRLIKGAPLWIGACHMGSQSSVRPTLSVQQKREVVRQGCTILLSDQGSKAIFPHECMQHSNIIFTKGFWDIHSSPQTIHSTSSSTSPSSTKSPSFTLIAFTVPFTIDCTGICIFMDSSITTSWSTEIFSPGLTKNSKITPAMLDTTRFILTKIPPFWVFSYIRFFSLHRPRSAFHPFFLFADVQLFSSAFIGFTVSFGRSTGPLIAL